MQPIDADRPEQGSYDPPTPTDAVRRKERAILARAREVARAISERVAKALQDTDIHIPPTTEENPPLA